ncbi:MAG: DUF2235 domain-containing protein [Gammaproteobacteria bacterium]|nr:DUF2235 domain-containing protein [Gammaproteobacteria bacterium]
MTQMGEGNFTPAEEKQIEEEGKIKIKIRFSIFFDGTLNNRTNVLEGVDSQAYKDAKSSIGFINSMKGVGSFENALSNIAKMEEHVNKNPDNYFFSTYIEGQGTTNFKADSFQGKAFGIAKTGVTQRAKKGLFAIVRELDKLNSSKIVIEKLTIDVFGFSRGAAAARNFLHQAMSTKSRDRVPVRSLKQRIESIGFEIDKLEIEFAGLFDTVSSVGLPSNHKRNSHQLHLDAISHAKDVVHLVAAEEHRKNFSLTNTSSAGDKEIYLPGVHSDIGGGYPDNYDESGLIIFQGLQKRAEAEQARLENSGWFKSGQLAAVGTRKYRGVEQTQTKLQIKERIVRNEYDRIPLHIMAEFARESGIDLLSKLERVYAVEDQLLLMVLNDLKPYAKERRSKAEDWLGEQEKWKGLRRQFLHVSAHYSGTGMEPRFINGRRKRLVYEG